MAKFARWWNSRGGIREVAKFTMPEFARWSNSHDGGIAFMAEFALGIIGKAEYAIWHNS
jgi:hypothetical protein